MNCHDRPSPTARPPARPPRAHLTSDNSGCLTHPIPVVTVSRSAFLGLTRAVAAAAVLWPLALPAQAQAHRCSSVNGVYYSQQPCPIDGGTKLGAFGPEPERSAPAYRPSAPRPAGRAPDHQVYMSAECASLADGIRTADSRGLSPSTRATLRDDYRQRCAADESAAMRRWSQDKRQDQIGRIKKEQEADASALREQAEQRRNVEQCGEMRRIIRRKHERLDTLSAGEVSDLRRFEANYTTRCPTRPL
jgi:hypothetical protein